MSNYVALVQPVDNELGAEGIIIGDMVEGSHTMTNEIVDKVRGGKTDRGYGANAEEMTFNANKVKGDEGQKALDTAIRNKKDLKVWFVPREVTKVIIDEVEGEIDGHDEVVFGYTVVSEIGHSFDSEEDTLEYTLAVKFETALGALPKLPDSVLDPSTVTVDFEAPGEYTGRLENRDNTTTTT